MADPLNLCWELEYIDGCGYRRDHLYGILCNLELVAKKFRPSFLIQPVDYGYCCTVLHKIYNNINACKIYEMYKIDQGILVYLNKKNSDDRMYEYIIKSIIVYSKGFYGDQIILGKLLGYPFAGDINKYKKGTVHLMIGDHYGIMSNCFTTMDKKTFSKKLKKIYQMKNYLKSKIKFLKIYVRIARTRSFS